MGNLLHISSEQVVCHLRNPGGRSIGTRAAASGRGSEQGTCGCSPTIAARRC